MGSECFLFSGLLILLLAGIVVIIVDLVGGIGILSLLAWQLLSLVGDSFRARG